MAKTSHILLAATCCMLAASVVLAAIAVIFHPTKSDAAKLIEELRPELQCALCRARLDKTGPKCEKCDNNWKTVDDEPEDETSCELTDARRRQLSEIVASKVNDGTRERQVKILKSAASLSTTRAQELIQNISYLNLNVPRPSAHWYLKEDSAKPQCQKNGCLSMRNVSRWEWQTGTEVAHSQNGISHHHGGQMKFDRPGWYHLYFQMDFRSNVTELMSYKARVLVPSGKEKDEKNYLMTAEERVKCSHHGVHSSPSNHTHSCVVLSGSGTFKLLQGDVIRVQIEMPREALLDTQKSRSYLGALYLRHI